MLLKEPPCKDARWALLLHILLPQFCTPPRLLALWLRCTARLFCPGTEMSTPHLEMFSKPEAGARNLHKLLWVTQPMPLFFWGGGGCFSLLAALIISLPEFTGLHQEVIYLSRLDTQHVITIDRELLSFHFSHISSWVWSEIMKLLLWWSIIHCGLNFIETCNSKISSALIPAACSALCSVCRTFLRPQFDFWWLKTNNCTTGRRKTHINS